MLQSNICCLVLLDSPPQVDLGIVFGPFVNTQSDSSMRRRVFTSGTDFIKKLLSNLTISGTNGVKIGILSDSTTPKIHYQLGKLSTLRDIEDALRNIPLPAEGSNQEKLAGLIRNQFFSLFNGVRLDVPKVLVFFTNGDLADGNFIKRLKQVNGIKNIIVSFGDDTNKDGYLDVADGEKSVFVDDNSGDLLKLFGSVQEEIFSPSRSLSTINNL